MMKAIAIKYPVVIMDNGNGFNIKDFEKDPLIGGDYKLEDGKVKLVGYSKDTDCVNGVCPIR